MFKAKTLTKQNNLSQSSVIQINTWNIYLNHSTCTDLFEYFLNEFHHSNNLLTSI